MKRAARQRARAVRFFGGWDFEKKGAYYRELQNLRDPVHFREL
jgi:hypothetical protein